MLTNIVGADPADVAHRPGRSSPTSRPPPETTARPSPCPASARHDPRPPHPLGALRRRPGQGRQLLPVDPAQGAAARRHRAHRAPPVRRRERLPRARGPVRAADPEGQRGRDRLRPRASCSASTRTSCTPSTSPASTTRCAEVIDAANRCGGVRRPVPPGPQERRAVRHYETQGPGRRASRWSRSTTAAASPARTSGRCRRPRATATAASAAATRTSSAGSGCCATEFADDIATIDDLVTALRAGRCEARTWRT